MKTASVITLVLLAASLLGANCFSNGAEPQLAADAILREWGHASNARKFVNATFTRFTYDRIFGTEEHHQGRFYWEQPGRACYLVKNDMSFVWSDGLLIIDPVAKTYWKYTIEEVRGAQGRRQEFKNLSFWKKLGHFGDLAMFFFEPEIILPFCTTLPTDDLQTRFDFTVTPEKDKIIVTATPKATGFVDVARCAVILDRGSFAVLAHQRISHSRQEVVHVFEPSDSPEYPIDREKLLTPDLSAFRELSFEVEPSPALIK